MKSIKSVNRTMFLLMLYQATLLQILIAAAYAFILLFLPNMPEPNSLAFLMVLQDLLLLALPSLFILFLFKHSFNEIIPLKKLSLWNIIYIVIISLVMLPVMSILGSITDIFFPADTLQQFNEEIFKLPFIVSLTVMAFLPAVLEETVYRGIFFGSAKKFDVKRAVVLSAVFFGLFHLSPYQLPYATFAGVIFAVAVYYTGSILSSMLMHFIINGTQVTAAYMLANAQETAEAAETAAEPVNGGTLAAFGVMLIIFGGLLALLLKGFIRYNRKTAEAKPAPAEENVKVNFIDGYTVGIIIVYVLYNIGMSFLDKL